MAVSSFLQSFRRAESVLFGSGASIQPIRVVIDRSIVLLISFLQVFNMETVHDYLLRTFRIVSGAGKPNDFEKLLPHACTSHVMNSAKKNCKKWYVLFTIKLIALTIIGLNYMKKFRNYVIAVNMTHLSLFTNAGLRMRHTLSQCFAFQCL